MLFDDVSRDRKTETGAAGLPPDAGPVDRVLVPANPYSRAQNGPLTPNGEQIVGAGARTTICEAGGVPKVIEVANTPGGGITSLVALPDDLVGERLAETGAAGLREGHFTLRARQDETQDVLGAVRREVPVRRAGAQPSAACALASWVPALRSNAPRCGASGTRAPYSNLHAAVSTTRSMNARTLAERWRALG